MGVITRRNLQGALSRNALLGAILRCNKFLEEAISGH